MAAAAGAYQQCAGTHGAGAGRARPGSRTMRDAMHHPSRRGTRLASAPMLALALALALAATACEEPEPTATPSPVVSATVAPPTSAPPVPTPTPSPTPPPFSLELPPERATATIQFSVAPNVPAEGTGEVLVTVTNTSDELIEELVMRWPTAIAETVHLAPFEPSPANLVNPLAVPWTRWVEGPGSKGEPAGTTSLGWGPMDPGMTLEIRIVATRQAAGAIEFDLQFLEGQSDPDYTGEEPEDVALLLTDDGQPAVTRVALAP